MLELVAHYTKDLCARKRWKVLLSSEQVLVRVGQLPMELPQLREPPPHNHLLHIFRMTLGHKLQAREEKEHIISLTIFVIVSETSFFGPFDIW